MNILYIFYSDSKRLDNGLFVQIHTILGIDRENVIAYVDITQ